MINIKITALHPKVADAMSQMIGEAHARGLKASLFCGLRTPEECDSLYMLGRTKINPDGISKSAPMGNIVTNAKAWESWHCYGLALDFAFKNEKGEWWWPGSDNKLWTELYKVGELFGFEWGGNWHLQKGADGKPLKRDMPHFQMRGSIKNTKEAKNILFEQGIDKLWSMV